MKSKKNQKKNLNIQHNKYVMYILLVVAFINLLMFLQNNYLGSILLFFAVGLITTLYTKNMNIILFSTILITNITVFIAKMFGYKEGLLGSSAQHLKCRDKDNKKFKLKVITEPVFVKDDEDEDGFVGSRGGADIQQLTGDAFKEGYAGNTKEGMKKGKKKGKKPPTKEPMTVDDDEEDDEGEGFKSIKEDIAESDNLTKSLRKNNISKDTEKEIKKMLKGTDLKNLDTNELIQQQKGLMDAMKNMDPLIKNVNDMITNLKNSPISSFMGLGK